MPYLAFDIGTSVLKAGLVSESGAVLAEARRPLVLRQGEGPNEHETDPGAWIQAALSAGAEVLATAAALDLGPAEREVRALAVSGNGPTLHAADASGMPLGSALSWMDRRASAEAVEVSDGLGMALDPSFYLPKALWLWRHRPGLAERAWAFFSCPEYLAFRLGAEPCVYLPDPGYLPYVWSEASVARTGIPPALFPPAREPGSRIGSLSSEAAASLGLSAGLPIVAGFPDFLASLVGSGVVRPGLAGDRGGTSEAINICAGRPFPDRRLLSLPHAVRGLWNLSGGLSTAGKALEWVARAGGYSGLAADSLFAEAQRSPPGARGLLFLPYLAGERAPLWDPDRRGAFLGLSLRAGREDLARAACEAMGYGLRLALELAREAGFPVESLRASGASARNDFLRSLKADILGLPVELPRHPDTELVGDAAACALALGEAESLAEAGSRMARIERREEPDARYRGLYDEGFARFRAALEALAPLDAAAAKAARAAAEGADD